jgi:NAD(P)-dependent dehydrogenase (short-subunit alcohol dehydrogenase family)
MNPEGKTAVVTGGGGGIGSALARALANAGASVVVADLDGQAAQTTASAISDTVPGKAIAFAGDVSQTDVIAALLAAAESAFGPVDIYCANAGVGGSGGLDADEDVWATTIDVNVLAHVRAAKLLIDGWLERGSGYFVATASAAGLLSQIGSAPYSVTKHAAVGFAEWLSITYGEPPGRPGRRGGRRHHRARRRRRLRPGGDGGGTVPRPPAPRGPRLHATQDVGLRPLAERHAPPAGTRRLTLPE